MSSLKEDPTRYTLFLQQAGPTSPTNNLPLKVLEWRSGNPILYYRHSHSYSHFNATLTSPGTPYEPHNLSSVTKLTERPPSDLRIIFAPLDIPNRETVNGHLALFKHLGV